MYIYMDWFKLTTQRNKMKLLKTNRRLELATVSVGEERIQDGFA